jgi:hypothetical protein
MVFRKLCQAMKLVMKADFVVLRMRCLHMLVILNVVSIPTSKCEEEVGADYLRSVISNLQSERVQPLFLWNNINRAHTTDDQVGTIMGPTPLPIVCLIILKWSLFSDMCLFLYTQSIWTQKREMNKVATKNLKHKLRCMFQTRKTSSPEIRRRNVYNLSIENPCTILNT